MIEKQNTKRRYNWTQAPRDARESRWSKLYASMDKRGKIALSAFTHKSMGSPEAYLLLYDAELNIIGLQAARLSVTKNAYPALANGDRGGCRMFAQRMLREFSLYIDETVHFPRCFIDSSGTLILEMFDTKRVSRKARAF